MDVMGQYPEKYFDLAVVDPPYGLNNRIATCNLPSSLKKHSLSKFRDKILNSGWDNYKPSNEYYKILNNKTKNQIIWGGNYFTNNLPESRCWICWHKEVPIQTMSTIELAWTSFDKPASFLKYRSRDENRFHPTQKPIKLYDWIYQKYLPQGGKVLDTHGGSMSNVISWIKAGNIDGVCTEIDTDYFHDAKKRIQNFLAQQDMFRNPVTVEFIENKMSMK